MPASLSIIIAAAPTADSQTLAAHISTEFGSSTRLAATSAELFSLLDARHPDLLIVDTSSRLPEPGIELVKKLRKLYPQLLLIPLIPASRRELVRHLLSLNVFFYIHTPIEPAETTIALTRATEHLGLHRNRSINNQSGGWPDFHGMIGASPPMRRLFDLIERVAADDEATVLIRGESGTGKEMVAKAIHALSERRAKNFVPVNCAAIPDDLLESELFGYTKGAFTGASANKIGRIQYADGGTLFLDEIGDMKPTLQAKLLRVLQEKEFEPVGAVKPIPVDTRILAATHCDLEHLVREGKFREDLYYRLSVIPLNIPALKDRRDDIPLLIDNFIHQFTARRNRAPFTFSLAAQTALLHFDWRGNVRELENLIQHMSILYCGRQVEFDDLPEKFQDMRERVEEILAETEKDSGSPDAGDASCATETGPGLQAIFDIPWHEGQVDFKALINRYETELIMHAMRLTDGNKKEAARLLNLKRTTLLEKIKKKALNNLWEE